MPLLRLLLAGLLLNALSSCFPFPHINLNEQSGDMTTSEGAGTAQIMKRLP